jgi:hypothetical protein
VRTNGHVSRAAREMLVIVEAVFGAAPIERMLERSSECKTNS